MKEMIVRLLGGFEARTAGDATLSFPTKKTKALLAYLSVHPGKSHSRSELAGLLWGDSGGEQARASLRQTLSYLRKALMPTGQEHLVVQDDLVSIDAATIQIDVATLESLTAQGIPETLERAGDLYQGDLLEGFDLDGEDFNDWLRTERDRFRSLVVEALKGLLEQHMANDQMSRGIRVANRLLEIDPLQEHAHRALMRLYLRHGERALALKQYEICQQTLMREVDSEPDDETKRVWNEARQSAMLPRHFSPPTPQRPVECTAMMQPAKEVGGDFYDVIELDDKCLGIVIADVAGKGAGAALFMARAFTILDAAARRGGRPGEVLSHLNDLLCVSNDKVIFVTVFYGVFDGSTTTLTFANAGHNPPILIRSDRRVEHLQLTGGVAVGVKPNLEYRERSIEIRPGDTVFCYTDGFTEAKNSSNEEFSVTNLEKVLADCAQIPVDDIPGRVIEGVNEFTDHAPPFDDMTCVVMRRIMERHA